MTDTKVQQVWVTGSIPWDDIATVANYANGAAAKRVAQWVQANRGKRASRDDTQSLDTGDLVVRKVGPFLTGTVVRPTRADWDRRWHAMPSTDDAVLVKWPDGRSWEYIDDLRSIAQPSGDL